ncbi:MAG TPA: hypothetical protein VFO27_04000, partial [Bryobacteraceae bacterium]|nr:hypothetical protein [Bryobacteraceae bacterium]
MMLWLPDARLLVVNVAVKPLSGTIPNGTPPSVNVTLPVGVKAPQRTMATRLIGCPSADGFCAELTTMLEAVPPTICVST